MWTRICDSLPRYLIAALLLGTATSAAAEGTPFELRVEAGRDSSEFTAPVFVIGPLPDPPPELTLDTAFDTLRIGARWYIDGLADAEAPRSRLPFATRASFLAFSYSSSDASTSLDFNPAPVLPPFPLPPPPGGGGVIIVDPAEFLAPPPAFEADEISIGGRYVSQTSGWYAFGSAAFGDAEIDGIPGSGIDTRRLTVGAGYYVARLTSIDVAVLDTDVDGSGVFDDSDTDVAVSLRHIGDVGDWQYGLDTGIVFEDDETLSWRGSLYPNRDIAFGLVVETRFDDFLSDGSRFELFGGWFLTPTVELFASIGRDDPIESAGASAESERYSLGLLARF